MAGTFAYALAKMVHVSENQRNNRPDRDLVRPGTRPALDDRRLEFTCIWRTQDDDRCRPEYRIAEIVAPEIRPLFSIQFFDESTVFELLYETHIHKTLRIKILGTGIADRDLL